VGQPGRPGLIPLDTRGRSRSVGFEKQLRGKNTANGNCDQPFGGPAARLLGPCKAPRAPVFAKVPRRAPSVVAGYSPRITANTGDPCEISCLALAARSEEGPRSNKKTVFPRPTTPAAIDLETWTAPNWLAPERGSSPFRTHRAAPRCGSWKNARTRPNHASRRFPRIASGVMMVANRSCSVEKKKKGRQAKKKKNTRGERVCLRSRERRWRGRAVHVGAVEREALHQVAQLPSHRNPTPPPSAGIARPLPTQRVLGVGAVYV